MNTIPRFTLSEAIGITVGSISFVAGCVGLVML